MTGGSAAHSGFSFQDRVAGFLAVHILAGQSIELLGLPAGVVPTEIHLETILPVDDILVLTSEDGRCFFNVKSTVTTSTNPESPLGLALDQFVKLWIKCRDGDGSNAWLRRLSPDRDRLALVAGPRQSSTFTRGLTTVLARIADRDSLEPFEAIATTQAENKVFRTVLGHLRQAYRTQTGEDFPDVEMVRLLGMVRVAQLDPNETHKTLALALLQTSVIDSPVPPDRAWSEVLANCHRMALRGSGSNRSGLLTRLRDSGIRLAGPPDILADVRRLRRAARIELESLAHLARLDAPTPAGLETIEIERSVTQALTEHARDKSMLVTGEPGSGKSGAIYSAAQKLISDDHPVVVLAVDRHPVSSLESLKQELGVENELVDILREWPGDSRGVLFIDALDASRGGPTDTVFQDLIRRTIRKAPNWSVVASIRAFDLRFGVQYRGLFRGTPVDREFSSGEFGNVRHLSVPKLTNKELKQIWPRSPAMEQAYRDGTRGLRELLCSPFNLFLLANVLSEGSYDLTQINTQIELLHLYWSHRVIGSDGGNIARERALRAALDEMLGEHQLSVRVDSVPVTPDLAFRQLLSDGVLLAHGGHRDQLRRISFSHHVLFDYAVARLVLEEGKAPDLASRLTKSEDDALMVAPASIMAFQILWNDEGPDRSVFWSTALELAGTKETGAFCRMLPARVAAGLVESLADFQLVLKCIASPDDQKREAASFLALHCIGALTMGIGPSESDPAQLGPWPRIAEALTRVAIDDARWMLKPLVSRWVEFPSHLDMDQKRYVGAAARRMLNYSIGDKYDESVVGVAIKGIARTFEVAPGESLASLRPLLHQGRVVEHGHKELSNLTREFDHLLRNVPSTSHFVRDVYRAAFCTPIPANEEVTSITGSRILNLTSTKAQDFELARYQLVKSLPLYFKASPESATETLIDLAECFLGARLDSDEPVKTIVVSGVKARYVADRSYGRTLDSRDREEPPLHQFSLELEALVDDGRVEDVDKVLRVVAQRNRLASVWAAVLRAGTHHPNVIGMRLLDVVTAKPVLEGVDTDKVACELLSILYPLLEDAERQVVEQALLDLEDWTRQEILTCLPLDKIVSDVLRSQKQDLGSQEESSPNRTNSPAREEAVWQSHDDDWWLRKEGVDLTIEENTRMRKIISTVERIWPTGTEESIDLNAAREIWSHVVELQAGLGSRSDIPMALSMLGWNALAEAAVSAARTARAPDDLDSFPGLIEIVLGSLTTHFWPRAARDPAVEQQFADHQGWESPAPRVEGAKALMCLCRIAPMLDPTLNELAESLATDPSPAIRMQIIGRAVTLRKSNGPLMNKLLEIGFEREENSGVLSRFLAGIDPVLKDNPEWFTERLIRMVDRSIQYPCQQSPGRHKRNIVDLIIQLWLVHNQGDAGVRVRTWIADPIAYSLEVRRALFSLRNAIILGDPEDTDPVHERIRAGAIELFQGVTKELVSKLSILGREPDGMRPEIDELAKNAVTILDRAADDLYFGCGAYEARNGDPDSPSNGRYSGLVRIRFLREMRSTLNALATVPYPGVTHRLLETLEVFIADDPRLVFRVVTHAMLSGGSAGGYQFEKMGIDLFLAIIRRYIAEHRGVVDSDPDFRQRLMQALDEFVVVGWPSALRFAYELPEELR